jgi:ribosomal protein S14
MCGILAIARKKNERTEAAFRDRLHALGGELLEPFHGGNKPHLVLCPAGHECSPRPNGVVGKGQGLCRICVRSDPATAEAAFLALLTAAGASSLEPAWTGVHRPHRLRCAEGHVVDPHPTSVLRGTGICRVCSGRDPAATEAAFRALLAGMGAVLLEPYKRADKPHHVRCAVGHDCYPQPSNALYGGAGICWDCRGRNWDVFYVLANTGNTRIKFGKTGRDGKQRLGMHRRDGYTEIIRLLTDLPGTMASDIETAVLRSLKRAGAEPIRGREYHDFGVLPIVLDVVSACLGTRDSAMIALAP